MFNGLNVLVEITKALRGLAVDLRPSARFLRVINQDRNHDRCLTVVLKVHHSQGALVLVPSFSVFMIAEAVEINRS